MLKKSSIYFLLKKYKFQHLLWKNLISKSFERLVEKGLNRGFITYEELQKSLGKRKVMLKV